MTNKKTKKIKIKKNKTLKNSISVSTKKTLVVKFMELLNLVKLYHWKTKVYAQHKATDHLYEKLNENIDRFIEVLFGKDESRIQTIGKQLKIIDSKNETDFKDKIFKFRTFLIDLNNVLNNEQDSDLLSIRDDMLSNINQFLYLMTFE